MPNRNWIYQLNHRKLPGTVGNKAKNLHRLHQSSFRIPNTFVISWDAFEIYQREGKSAVDHLRNLLLPVLNPNKSYAVRSSANIEDDPEHSFAGMFLTLLNVETIEDVIESIHQVWNSVRSESVKSYLNQAEKNAEELKMAVILQEMIRPKFSGVAFSRNPITLLEEVLIEAVEGLGTQLVQDGINPFRWINKWGNWIEQPDDSPISPELLDKITSQTRQISKVTKRDVDLEWVYDGENLYWLQMRDITALSKENIYSNKISKEMMPGLTQPLVWSVNVPNTAGVWIDLFAEILGKRVAEPHDLVKPFHYQSYFNVGVFGKIFDELGMPRETLEIMQGIAPKGIKKPGYKPNFKMVLHMPRLLVFLYDKWTFGRKAERLYPELVSQAKHFPIHPDASVSLENLAVNLDRISILNQKVTYNLVISMLLMQVYNQTLASLLESQGVDFQQFNLTEGMAELEQFDPSRAIAALGKLIPDLPQSAQLRIQAGEYQALKTMPEAESFIKQFDLLITSFGHMSDATTNFGKVPWRETPDLILKMIADYQQPLDLAAKKISYKDLKQNGIKGWMTGLFYRRARQFHLLREKNSSIYTYTLMLFRAVYLAVGERLVQNGLIQQKEDIFYLYDEEIRSFINNQTNGSSFNAFVQERKDGMEQAKNIIMPEIVFGEQHPPVVFSVGQKLSGTPTSRGYYTGKVRVITGINDFSKLKKGDVLVIPYSDVSWLPLFSKAGAVIAESGGILSHSSIIAREYGIPAVVSVSGALSLNDDTIVSIDGYKGEIIIHADVAAEVEEPVKSA